MKYTMTLPLEFTFEEIELMIYISVLKDAKGLILVDCGYPFFLSKIEQAMKERDMHMKNVVKIIITHHDHDHMGALKEIIDNYPEIEVICSSEQQPYVTGKAKSLRLIQAEQRDKMLTAKEKIESKKFMDFISSVKKVNAVTTVNDGDILNVCGGVEIIDTSGHMPGHISLYVSEDKTLIAGDALVVENGKLGIAVPEFVLDREIAIASVKKLLKYEIKKIICYHGGEYATDIKMSLERIINDNKVMPIMD